MHQFPQFRERGVECDLSALRLELDLEMYKFTPLSRNHIIGGPSSSFGTPVTFLLFALLLFPPNVQVVSVASHYPSSFSPCSPFANSAFPVLLLDGTR